MLFVEESDRFLNLVQKLKEIHLQELGAIQTTLEEKDPEL